ncbi:MAG: hypothetical protein PHX78_07040 [bacterium]|nr:hypothetical protein [bacterium]
MVFLRLIILLLAVIIPFSVSLANWSKETIISDKNLRSTNPSITSDNKGNIYAVWQTNGEESQDIYFSKYDGRWSPIDKITESKGKPQMPVIISDVFNNLHLVWQDKISSNYNIYFESFYKNFSNGWLKNIKVSRENSQAADPDIAADKTGNIHVVWKALENDNYEIYYKKFDPAKGWEPDIKLTKGSVSAASPKLAVDKYNNLHLAWRDNRDGNYEIYYKYFDGKNWSDDFRITNDPASSENPEIAVDNYQNVHIVWRDNRDKTYAIYYKKWNGKIWEPDQRISNITNASASTTNPAITIDILGVIHVVWQDNRDGNYEIYYKKFDGKWSEDSRVTNDKFNSYNPKIISDSVANLHLVWYNQENDSSYIYYKKFVSPRPLIKAVKDTKVNNDTGAAGQAETSLAINTYGETFICWADVRLGEFNSDIYAQFYNNDFIKAGDNFRVNNDKKSAIQGHPRVSLFSNDYFGVVWQDERNENSDIYCQVYDVGCEPKGDNYKINDDKAGSDQDQPDIAGLKNKPALVVWRDERDGQLEIYGQILDTTISFIGKNFKITQSPKKMYCRWPTVSASGREFYIAAWADNRGGNWDIYGQKIQADGKLTGKNFKINEISTENCNHPSVACDLNGNFLVTWWSSGKGNTVVVYAQFFDENSKPVGKNFLVGDTNNGDIKQIDPVTDIDTNGNSVIAWLDYRNGDPDIYAQRYDPKGTNINYNFQVNDYTIEQTLIKTGSTPIYEGIIQNEPEVKFQQKGNIVFTWVDHRLGNPDIFACRFEPVNMLPIADPGSDLMWEVNMPVTLDGSASRDPDGDTIVSYSWIQTAGPAVTLENPQSSRPGFTPKAVGQYTFKLIVNDGLINSEPALVNITAVDNTPPTITIENIYPVNKENIQPIIKIDDNSNLPVDITITLDEGSYTPGTMISAKGNHILDVIAVDKCGNTSYKQIKFSIE